MKARDLMTPNPRAVTVDTPLVDAARLMRDLDVGMLPVVDDLTHLHPRGVLTDRDIVVRCVAERHLDRPVEEAMSMGYLGVVEPDSDVSEVMEAMRSHQIRRLLVTDRGRLVGVIAQADLALKDGPREPARVEAVFEAISRPPLRI